MGERLTKRGLAVAAIAVAIPVLAPAVAQAQGSVLGIPCTTQSDGVRTCSGNLSTTVKSWDGTPLDVDVTLPPASQPGPYPLIFGIHGFASNKLTGWDQPRDQGMRFARQGYATVAYSARGLAFSCGTRAGGALPGCSRGWIHLADARFEVRDTQHIAGLLADAGIAKPDRIGVTGASYGGGQSLMLATLRDRVMLPDGRLVPWRSPQGKPMRIAAAAPKIGWSDLAYALVPSGRTLDYRARNPYRADVGIVKQSYLEGLFATTYTTHVAAPGQDAEADITTWKEQFAGGDPYDQALVDRIKSLFERHRSPYYVQEKLGDRGSRPAPLLIYNGWNDDIMPASEPLRYANLLLDQFPDAQIGLVLAAEFAHNRGSLAEEAVTHNRERDILFARYLKGDQSAKPLSGVLTRTHACGGAPGLGPFRTSSWRAQHPGEVRFSDSRARRFDSRGGSAATAAAIDPFAGPQCPQVQHSADPGAVTYELPPSKRGYTLLGSPTIDARLKVSGTFPQVASRLWDVSPDGSQTLVTRGSLRPEPSGRQVFQMHPTGWHFRPGHRPKIELLGRDAPYSLPSNAPFSIEVSHVTIDLPVHQRADGDQIFDYDPPELCTPIGRSARRGRRLGPVALGRTRRTNRRAFEDFRPRGRFMDSSCVDGGRVRVGYPVSRRARRLVKGRAVLALSSTDRLSAAGVRVGQSERSLRRRVKPRWRYRIGRNRWYVKRSGNSALVFKVRRRRVLEVGVASPSLTRNRRSARRLLAAYRGP